jgi:hypothetical protein
MRFHASALVVLLGIGGVAQAATPDFSDNFDASISGLNVVPTDWSVTDGTVDVVGGGFCTSGQCVDLDGSTGDAGVLSRQFSLFGGTAYTLAFDLAGNMRGGTDDVTISFGTSVLALTAVTASTPYTTYSVAFTPAANGLFAVSFSNAGGDNVGTLLDNVSITAVPEPATFLMMFAGLLAMCAIGRNSSHNS